METKQELVVNSDKDMTIASEKKISLAAKGDMAQSSDKKMNISAKSQVGISCKASSIKLNGEMDLKASKIKEN